MGIIQLCLLQEYFKEWLKCILPCAPKVENLKGNQARVFCYLRASPHQNIHFCLSQWSEHNGPLPNEHSEHNGKPGVFLANTFSRTSFGRWGEVHHLSQQPPASLCILQSCHDWLQHFFFFFFSPTVKPLPAVRRNVFPEQSGASGIEVLSCRSMSEVFFFPLYVVAILRSFLN